MAADVSTNYSTRPPPEETDSTGVMPVPGFELGLPVPKSGRGGGGLALRGDVVTKQHRKCIH